MTLTNLQTFGQGVDFDAGGFPAARACSGWLISAHNCTSAEPVSHLVPIRDSHVRDYEVDICGTGKVADNRCGNGCWLVCRHNIVIAGICRRCLGHRALDYHAVNSFQT